MPPAPFSTKSDSELAFGRATRHQAARRWLPFVNRRELSRRNQAQLPSKRTSKHTQACYYVVRCLARAQTIVGPVTESFVAGPKQQQANPKPNGGGRPSVTSDQTALSETGKPSVARPGKVESATRKRTKTKKASPPPRQRAMAGVKGRKMTIVDVALAAARMKREKRLKARAMLKNARSLLAKSRPNR